MGRDFVHRLRTAASRVGDRLCGPFRNRPDSEHEQSLVRLGLGLAASIYLAVTTYHDGSIDPHGRYSLWLATIFLLMAISWLAWIAVRPERCPLRRVLGILSDLGACCAAMYLVGRSGAPFYVILLWVIFGNGFRYGQPYLATAAVLGALGFGTIATVTPFWRSQPQLSFGLWIGLIVLPLYVSSLLRRLTNAVNQAQEASHAKGQFLANMSHEVRTPLNAVLGSADLLETTSLTRNQSELVHTIRSSAGNLLSLVENVLDLSKIEAGKFQAQKIDFDLYMLLHDLMYVFLPQSNGQGVRLALHVSPEMPFRVRGDPTLLRQVLVNLIGNALKFTEEGSVEITVGAEIQDETSVVARIDVCDTGPGIAPAFQAKIFERFMQADPSITRRHGGSGLGTAIARELVELMGGKIGLQSTLGAGSTFWFTVPLARQTDQDVPSPLDAPLPRRGRAIIVAPPSEALQSLQSWLEGWSLESALVETGAQARSRMIAAAGEGQPMDFAIVSGSHLGVDTHEFAALVKGDPLIRSVRLILLTELPIDREHSIPPGYETAIRWPAAKSTVFNAIHFIRAMEDPGAPVVRLRDPQDTPKAQGCGYKILVAEDNPVNQKIISKILEQAGHTVRIAPDGEEALEALESQQFDLALLDLHMPGMSGLEVAKTYRFMAPRGEGIPLVALTADALPQTQANCAAAGFQRFLSKPAGAAALLEVVNTTARRGQSTSPMLVEASGDLPPGRAPGRAVLDEAVLRDLEDLDDGKAFVNDLIEVFVVDAEQILREIDHAVHRANLDTFRDLAHALRGSASTVGAVELHEVAARASSVTVQELRIRGQAYVDEVRGALETTRAHLMHRSSVSRRLLP